MGHDRAHEPADVAVIGLAGRFPGARDVGEFWDNLAGGRETISFFTERELKQAGVSPAEFRHPDYVRAKGILDDIDSFDANFFGYAPREAERMDPQLRLVHECSWSALEDAGYDPDRFDGRIGVYLGANENHEWIRRVRASLQDRPEGYDAFLLTDRDYFATRISYKLDLKGPSFTLLSACATSLVAIHLACRSLMHGECEMALAGGVSLSLPDKRGYVWQEGLMISSDGHCRTFDARADGTVFGDGAGVVLLKPLARAIEDGDHVYSVIRGSAINNDGNGKVSFTAPSAEGQAAVIREAFRRAGVEPETIGYVEAHGTATHIGDPIEIDALTRAFDTEKKHFCRLGSVKTNIGHVNIAAGVSAFIKTALALDRRLIPPTLHFDSPNPNIDFANSPFRINTELMPWPRNGTPRRAGVSAFGFGGTNAHVVLEEAPPNGTGKAAPARPRQLLVLSAKTPTALRTAADNLAGLLEARGDVPLADAAYTLAVGRKPMPCRLSVTATGRKDAIAALRDAAGGATAGGPCKPVFLFPGQGAQYAGMARELYHEEPVFRDAVDRCTTALEPLLGRDLRPVLFPEPGQADEMQERLRQTELAQPAVFTISWALAQMWQSWGVEPAALVGHSIGECAAACVAGVLSVEDALRLLTERGRMMQALPPGRMLAVSLAPEKLAPLLPEAVEIAAFNGPELCVASGPSEEIETLRRRLRKQRVVSHVLSASHAFHSRWMEPVLDRFRTLVGGMRLQEPTIPIVSTVTAAPVGPGEMTDPMYWARNVRRPVRFSEAIVDLLERNEGAMLEIGPGRTLIDLVRVHPGSRGRTLQASIPGAKERTGDLRRALESLGKLWESGVRVDWNAFWSGERRQRVPLPTYPYERRRFWIDHPSRRDGHASLQELLDTKIDDVADWFWVPSWKRSPLPAAAGPRGRRSRKRQGWLLFMDDCGVGERIAERLEQNGDDVIRLHRGDGFAALAGKRWSVDPSSAEDYEAFCAELRETKRFPTRIVHLWNIDGVDGGSMTVDSAERYEEIGFFSLLRVAQIIGREGITDPIRIWVVADRLHEVTGSERLIPEKAPLLGPVKVIPQEYANVRCSNVDLEVGDDPGRAAESLWHELRGEIRDLIVAWRGRHRWVQTTERIRLERPPRTARPLREDGVVLITGGFGGIGLVLAEYVARTTQSRLVLVGRKRLPARKRWDEWLETHPRNDATSRKIRGVRKLEKLGARVRLVAADVAHHDRMRREIERVVRAWGPITGVIHAAGVPGEGILQLKSPQEARKIFSAKVRGTLVLDDVLGDTPLDFFVLCSSIASILGGIGLGDYCAANAFLDAFAARQRLERDAPVVAVNWDMWGQVGMGLTTHMPAELKDWFERELRNGITSAEGVDAFRRILERPDLGQVVVSTRDLQARIDMWLRRKPVGEDETAADAEAPDDAPYARPDLSTEFDPPENETEKQITEIWAGMFGIDRVGRRDNFYELGGHSLLATSLLTRLRKQFEANISIRDVLDNPTVCELSSVIDERRHAAG